MNTLSRRMLLAAGGASALTLLLSGKGRNARASEGYAGPLVCCLHAGGGWDTTLFCNGLAPSVSLQQNLYAAPARVGAFSVAPLTLTDSRNASTVLDDVPTFFTDLGDRLLVINGIDTQTNSHDTGVKHVWSGKAFEELPGIGALAAGQASATYPLPLAFLGAGGYDATANVVPITRMPDLGTFRQVLSPHVINPSSPRAGQRRYLSPNTAARVSAAQATRLERASEGASSVREREALSALGAARQRMGALDVLADLLPAAPITATKAFPKLGATYVNAELDGYLQSAELALLAFKSGQAVSANLTVGGFDTHAAHDSSHTRQLGLLCLTIRYLFTTAAALGLSDRFFLVVGSDFGRTPSYNPAAGKDHWNVTSMMVAGPGVRGGRVLGGTDEQLRPLGVDAANPAALKAVDDPAATRLLPGHVQRALRRRIGISAALDARFALPLGTPLDDLLA